MSSPTVLIVPGLRDAVATHWQTHLEAELRALGQPVLALQALGRDDLGLAPRIQALDAAVLATPGLVVLVAHSGGVIQVAHWAHQAHALTTRRVAGALLAAPPDFDTPMPAGYPSRDALAAAGWLPVPRSKLPFPSLVCTSRNDPLAQETLALALAADWGSATQPLGAVGHLNPASGFGPWPGAWPLVQRLFPA